MADIVSIEIIIMCIDKAKRWAVFTVHNLIIV